MSGRNSIVAMGESSKAAFEFPTSALIYPEPCESWLRDEHRPVYPLPFDSLEANRSREAPHREAFSKGVGMVYILKKKKKMGRKIIFIQLNNY